MKRQWIRRQLSLLDNQRWRDLSLFARGVYDSIWMMAGTNGEEATLGLICYDGVAADIKIIAWRIGCTQKDAMRGIKMLLNVGLIEQDDNGAYWISKYAEKSSFESESAERVRRFRAKSALQPRARRGHGEGTVRARRGHGEGIGCGDVGHVVPSLPMQYKEDTACGAVTVTVTNNVCGVTVTGELELEEEKERGSSTRVHSLKNTNGAKPQDTPPFFFHFQEFRKAAEAFACQTGFDGGIDFTAKWLAKCAEECGVDAAGIAQAVPGALVGEKPWDFVRRVFRGTGGPQNGAGIAQTAQRLEVYMSHDELAEYKKSGRLPPRFTNQPPTPRYDKALELYMTQEEIRVARATGQLAARFAIIAPTKND